MPLSAFGGLVMKYFLRIFFSFSFIFFSSLESPAANPGPITFTQSKIINFGNITKSTSNVVSTVAETNSNRGQILLKDGNNNTNTINLTFQGCSNSNYVRLKNFTAKYGTTTLSIPAGDGASYTVSGLANPANSGTTLQYGATIVVGKDAALGSQTPCYNITMQYDCVPTTCTNAPVTLNNGSVVVLGAPMALNDVDQMDFGPMTKPTINSTVVMQPNGTMNRSAGNTLLLNGTAGIAGRFSLVVEKSVSISIIASDGALTGGLRLISMTASLNGGATTNIKTTQTFTTNSTGTNDLRIGGTLDVRTGVAIGTTSVPYTLVLNYQ
jgi:hypothetical protein